MRQWEYNGKQIRDRVTDPLELTTLGGRGGEAGGGEGKMTACENC